MLVAGPDDDDDLLLRVEPRQQVALLQLQVGHSHPVGGRGRAEVFNLQKQLATFI